MYKYIFFDLDGTLTDPGVGITNAVMKALEKFNIELPGREELYKFIGPPLKDSFMNFYKMSEADALCAIKYYREYYSEIGLFENIVYDGIVSVLEQLKSEEYVLAVATSKPYDFSKRILDKFDLTKYFDFLGCASMSDKGRNRKADVIKYTLESLKITDTSKVLMIGDRFHDVIGARECGIDCIGVTYGYGDRAEHEKYNAKYIVDSVEEIIKVVHSAQ